jgi:hypothetical protein
MDSSMCLASVKPWVQTTPPKKKKKKERKKERKWSHFYETSCKKNDFFYQSICYSLRLLKNSSGRHLRWFACLKGSCCFFWIPVQLHCLEAVCPSPSPKPFSQLREIVNLCPGQVPGEGQVQLCRGCKEEPLSAILCLCVCSAGVSTCLHPLDQEKIALSRFSVSCVSVFSTRGLSIPTLP